MPEATAITMLNVFHISDLHFTSEESGQLRDAATASVRSILELADTLKGDGTLGPNVCVLITGDIVQGGASVNGSGESDFDAVQKALLEPLLELLSIGPDRVFLVPGNHDLDRHAVEQTDWQVNGQSAASAICEADIDNDLRKKLEGYFEFVEKHGYRSVTRAQPRVAFHDCDGQQVVCFNGLAGAYSRKGNGDKGELFVLGSELAGSLSAIERNAVVLTHHPLSWFADRCGNDLKEFLSSKHCRLFTGHVHDRGIDRTETPQGRLRYCSGGRRRGPGRERAVSSRRRLAAAFRQRRGPALRIGRAVRRVCCHASR